MTTSATTSSSLMSFPRYPELPPELRLQIIEETLNSARSTDGWGPQDGPRMSTFACIDHEWNQVVELRLFKDIKLCSRAWDNHWATRTMKQELADFGAICGKRSGRLSRILLTFYDCGQPPFGNHPHLHTLFQLFDLMKDWNHGDREQQGLIEIRLYFGLMEDPLSWRPDYPYDLDKVPPVPVIGSIHEPRPEYQAVRLHPCILAGICQKLSNVHHASLTLPPGPSDYVSAEDFINAMDSLRTHNPSLTHLDLRVDSNEIWRHGFGLTMLPIIQRLNDSPSPWSERLVSLKVQHNIVVEDFLRDASKINWPNLKAIKLVGTADVERQGGGTQVDKDDANAFADESGSRIIEALITTLPSMPNATNFQIRITFKRHDKAFKVSIHLGNIARTEKAGKLLPCVDSFVPNSNNGTATGYGMYLHGDTAVQLQDAVRAYRRQELEVFACSEDRLRYHRKPHRPCAKWNRRTENWDPVFKNNMDIFIYEMGQYWEALVQMGDPW